MLFRSSVTVAILAPVASMQMPEIGDVQATIGHNGVVNFQQVNRHGKGDSFQFTPTKVLGFNPLSAHCTGKGKGKAPDHRRTRSFEACSAECKKKKTCVAFEFQEEEGEGECTIKETAINKKASKDSGDCGEASCCYVKKPKPNRFKGYDQVSARCKTASDTDDKGNHEHRKHEHRKHNHRTPLHRTALQALRQCKKECDDNLGCAGFEFANDHQDGKHYNCAIFTKEVDLGRSEEDEDGDCNLESCCFVKDIVIGDDGTISAPGGSADDEGSGDHEDPDVEIGAAASPDDGDAPDSERPTKTRLIETTVSGIQAVDQQEIVDLHNDYRRTETVGGPASNMRKMEWDDKLAEVAQNFAETGAFTGHNNNRKEQYQQLGGTEYVGENWFSGEPVNGRSPMPTDTVHAWCTFQWPTNWGMNGCSEKQNYEGTCSGVDGHYTQVMWANSYKVGCGWTATHGTVCNYAPGGNYNNQNPWEHGPPCSNCPSDAPLCCNDLCCNEESGTGSSTTTAAPTTTTTTWNIKKTCAAAYSVAGLDTCQELAVLQNWVNKSWFQDNVNKPTGCYVQTNKDPHWVYYNAYPGNTDSKTNNNRKRVCVLSAAPAPTTTTVAPTTAPPTPADCPDANPTGISLSGNPASCDQLLPYCSSYSIVQAKCPTTCGSDCTPPAPSPPGSGGTCCSCASSADCSNGMTCCPGMKKCITSSATSCYTHKECCPAVAGNPGNC